MKPPIDAASLDGQRVLLLALSLSDPDAQYVLAGSAYWTGSALEVQPDESSTRLRIPPVHAEHSSFHPNVLWHLIAAEDYEFIVRKLAATVSYCIPLPLEGPLQAGVHTPGLIAGVATSAEGELFLMQVR